MNDFVSPRIASKHFGVSVRMLREWGDKGLINYIKTKKDGGHRRYRINSFKNPNSDDIYPRETKENKIVDERRTVCYCRVSSRKQKDDLARQEKYLESLYPRVEIIKDVGSGLNFKRKGLLFLLEESIKGNIKEIIVAHKDRICRFGFELLVWLFAYYEVKLTILKQDRISRDQELTNDILAILHVFSCRANGKRKYSKEQNAQETEPERTS